MPQEIANYVVNKRENKIWIHFKLLILLTLYLFDTREEHLLKIIMAEPEIQSPVDAAAKESDKMQTPKGSPK